MTKADLVKEVSKSTGVTKKDAAIVLDSLLIAISDALVEGERIEIRGFGTFNVKTREVREGRNPKTGETVQIPQRRVPCFKFSRELKNRVLEDN